MTTYPSDAEWDYLNAVDDFAKRLDQTNVKAEWEGEQPDWHREMMQLRGLLVKYGAFDVGEYKDVAK